MFIFFPFSDWISVLGHFDVRNAVLIPYILSKIWSENSKFELYADEHCC